MGPSESLHRTKQQIQRAARQGVKLAKSGSHRATTSARSLLGRAQKAKIPRTGIVSINGHDVEITLVTSWI